MVWVSTVSIIVLATHHLAFPQKPFTLSGSLQKNYAIGQYIEIIPDGVGVIEFEEIIEKPNAFEFVRDTNLTTNSKQHWIRFSVENHMQEHIDWLLYIVPKQCNEVFRVCETDTTFIARNGEYVKNSQSVFPENPSVIPVKIPSNQVITFYVRINTEIEQEFKPWVSINLRPAEVEMKSYLRNWIILAVLVGMLVSLGFYILFQYILFRDKSFLYFFLAFSSMALYFIAYERVGYAISGWDSFTRFTGNYIALFCTFSYIGFSRYFLDTEKKFSKWHSFFKWFQVFYVIPLVLIILINLGFFWNFTPFIHIIHIIAFVFLLTFAITTFRKNHYLAGYYLWANTIFFTFLCAFVVYVIVKPNTDTLATHLLANSLKIGSFGQVLLFTLALSNRIGLLNRRVLETELEKERMEKDQILRIQDIITNTNLDLEQKVKERTSEINSQKEELKTQAENIESAYQEISKQKMIIEKAHSQITDSLYYASLIQRAVLPSNEIINKYFDQNFILYWPRDIVSGDFYWAAEVNNQKLFAVADCTGHGVPGAFMSMLGISLLNEIVKREHITKPSEVLDNIKDNLLNALQQEDEENEVRDGMVIAFCAISDQQGKTILDYAGSHTPCYIIKSDNQSVEPTPHIEKTIAKGGYSLYTIKPDNIPISKHFKDKSFKNYSIELKQGDMVYITSDGIIDQLGGPDYKKFSTKRLQEILLDIHLQDANSQKDYIEKKILDWINYPDPETGSPSDQIDDICLVGIRI
jgi:serine phosphatase RsbU (regulator of sigma subunit)